MIRTREALSAWVAAACVLLSAGCEWQRWRADVPVGLQFAPGTTAGFGLKLQSAGRIPMPEGVPAAHASALTVLPSGELLAVWWAGERESSPDVQVYAARWAAGQWSVPHAVVDRANLGRQLGFGVRRLGNPAVWVAPDGRVHLFVVATGLGGWAAARVVQLVSTDQGGSFTAQRILPLTPLADTSVLVRTNPVGQADGGWLLPAYFEIGHKYPLLISFDRDGTPRWLSRIGRSITSLQPALLPLSATELRAFMRDTGPTHRVQQAVSLDAGRSWQDAPPAELFNQDSSVAVARLTGGGFVMVRNDAPPAGGSTRQGLSLATSLDAEHWVAGPTVRAGEPGDEFSYPAVQQLGAQLHVTYTDKRDAIGHAVYDIAYSQPTP